MTTDELFAGKIAEKLNSNAEKVKALKTIYQFDLLGETPESWCINLTKDSDFVCKGPNPDAKCVVSVKFEDLLAIVERKLNPQMAFMSGKLKVKGDMSLALKLGSIL